MELMSCGACGELPFQGLLSCEETSEYSLPHKKMSGRFSRMIYVGNLPLDIREREIEDLFYKYGRIVDIELKIPPRPPGYCFVEFEDARDAEDAIRGRDGYKFDGSRLRVELAHGGRGQLPSGDRRGGYGGGSGYGGGGGGARLGGGSRHSEYRVVVRGLPSSASWQDLKDHMRKAGDVTYANVYKKGDGAIGLVDYTNYDDVKYAIRKLSDTEFKNPFTRSYIRVEAYEGSESRSRSRSRSKSRSRSRSRSLGRKHGKPTERSVSRSASPAKRSASPAKKARSRSKSASRSRSRSISRSVSPRKARSDSD